ncbi:MAG TPA: tetratricopeptide repeat protein [Alphaproteobacteria bacterium]|nr:tetratricopeptide repeat protein [Alphaproteobacteria bacterium]
MRHLEEGGFAQAADLCRPLLAINPTDADARFLLGLALGGLGQEGEAISLLFEVVAARPGHPDAHRELARILAASGRRGEAETQYRAAIGATPRDPLTLCDFGRFLNEEGRHDEAGALAEAALVIQPDLATAHNLLGVARVGQGRMDAAVRALRRAATFDPRNTAALANLGTALATEKRFAESIDTFDKALVIAPKDVTIRLNRGIALLKSGNFSDGWSELEWRHLKSGREKLPGAARLPKLSQTGSLDGRRIVVWHEEGFGDTIQFLRYMRLLAEAGATVTAWMPKELMRLAGRVTGVDRVLTGNITLSEFDYHCPINSLPYVFDTLLEKVPETVPYIDPDPDLVRSWSAKLPRGGRPRVGLVWSGEPRPYDLAAVQMDRRRSLRLAMLRPLTELPQVEFVSLQMGQASAELASSPTLFDAMRDVSDFADTAAIIANLDMVVSVDTAVVHLAGAMGKPVFLLDRYDNCWRWLAGREDSPWYPTMRIFRQERPGEWAPVITRAAAALKQILTP